MPTVKKLRSLFERSALRNPFERAALHSPFEGSALRSPFEGSALRSPKINSESKYLGKRKRRFLEFPRKDNTNRNKTKDTFYKRTFLDVNYFDPVEHEFKRSSNSFSLLDNNVKLVSKDLKNNCCHLIKLNKINETTDDRNFTQSTETPLKKRGDQLLCVETSRAAMSTSSVSPFRRKWRKIVRLGIRVKDSKSPKLRISADPAVKLPERKVNQAMKLQFNNNLSLETNNNHSLEHNNNQPLEHNDHQPLETNNKILEKCFVKNLAKKYESLVDISNVKIRESRGVETRSVDKPYLKLSKSVDYLGSKFSKTVQLPLFINNKPEAKELRDFIDDHSLNEKESNWTERRQSVKNLKKKFDVIGNKDQCIQSGRSMKKVAPYVRTSLLKSEQNELRKKENMEFLITGKRGQEIDPTTSKDQTYVHCRTENAWQLSYADYKKLSTWDLQNAVADKGNIFNSSSKKVVNSDYKKIANSISKDTEYFDYNNYNQDTSFYNKISPAGKFANVDEENISSADGKSSSEADKKINVSAVYNLGAKEEISSPDNKRSSANIDMSAEVNEEKNNYEPKSPKMTKQNCSKIEPKSPVQMSSHISKMNYRINYFSGDPDKLISLYCEHKSERKSEHKSEPLGKIEEVDTMQSPMQMKHSLKFYDKTSLINFDKNDNFYCIRNQPSKYKFLSLEDITECKVYIPRGEFKKENRHYVTDPNKISGPNKISVQNKTSVQNKISRNDKLSDILMKNIASKASLGRKSSFENLPKYRNLYPDEIKFFGLNYTLH